jgi:prepilin-type N-terminal cleavage/methylation domain-containing protein
MRRNAFSLIELAVVMLIVGLLLALAAPALSRARVAAEDAGSLSKLRSNASIFAMYTMDWQDAFPAFADPDATMTLVRIGEGHYIRLYYFLTHYYWQFVMADAYYDGVLLPPAVTRPGKRFGLSYHYSCSFLADPRYWTPDSPQPSSLWRGTREPEARFPSHKAVLVEFEPGTPSMFRPPGRLLMGFVDASAGAFEDEELTTPLRSGEGSGRGRLHHHGVYGMHTVEGVRGRDVAGR